MADSERRALVGTIAFTLVVPGTVIVLIPYLLTGWNLRPPFLGIEATRSLGGALIVLAAPLFFRFLAGFVREGHGTPAPIAPPEHLVVGGPFRCYDDYPDCWRRQKERRYVVHMDFQVRVPERIALRLATVNEGRVSVENVTGSFKVNNVNGDVTMRNVGGSGEAKTVNGPVKVSFRENPRETSEFTTVNGDIELVFAKRPDADFHFKTWNGDVTSDFPMTALPAEPAVGERKDGRFVYRSERYTGGRCGSGGPDVTIQNLNGDIRILESGS